MEVTNQTLFATLQDNFEWINKHGDEFLKKMKTFYASLPDDNQMKVKVIRELQSIEIIPEASKDFKITKTHQTITSYFMSQVFNGYQNSIVYYVDDIIPTYNSFINDYSVIDDSTIEDIYKLKLSDEQKFKMELLLRSSSLIYVSERAHTYILNSIFDYIHDMYFRNLMKSQAEAKIKEEVQDESGDVSNMTSEISSKAHKFDSDEEVENTKNDNSKLSETHEMANPEIKYVEKPYEKCSIEKPMNEKEFRLFVESILQRYTECFDYMMVLALAGDSLRMDLLENIEEMDVEIFKYVYDFVYLNEKSSKKNKKVLNMLKREEIIEFLHLVKLPISMDESSSVTNKPM